MNRFFRLSVCLVAWIVIVSLGTLSSPAHADSFTVTDWDLGVGVYRNGDDFAGDGFLTPINPFIAAHQVTLPSSPATTAAAQYDFVWAEEFGQFLIAAQLAAQDGNSVRSTASGTIYLQTDTALTLSVDAVLDYNLPTYGLGADLSFEVRDITADEYIFGQGVWYDTFLDPPAAGSLGVASAVDLPANHQFRIQYQIGLDTYGFSTGLAAAEGHVNFTLAPVPEPWTTSLLLLGTLVLARPRRRRRC